MPLPIKPEGLFHGERLHRCSDEARKWWPHFWCASNNRARVCVHYSDLLRTVFDAFRQPPNEAQVAALFAEYQENFLCFLYRDPDTGLVWGQWDTDIQPRFTANADNTSPAPPPAEFDAWRRRYQAEKSQRSAPLLNLAQSHGVSRGRTVTHGDSPRVTGTHGESPEITEPHGDSPLRVRARVKSGGVGFGGVGLRKNKTSFELPEWIPAETWAGFEEMRRSQRKPLTDRARVLTVRALEKLRGEGHSPVAVLEQSTQNSWLGVFPIRGDRDNGKAKRGSTRDASDLVQQRRKAKEQNAAR